MRPRQSIIQASDAVVVSIPANMFVIRSASITGMGSGGASRARRSIRAETAGWAAAAAANAWRAAAAWPVTAAWAWGAPPVQDRACNCAATRRIAANGARNGVTSRSSPKAAKNTRSAARARACSSPAAPGAAAASSSA